MTDSEQEKRDLLDRIEVLLEEANALPRTRNSWERRTEIEWQILQLCRRIASMSTAPLPYWADGRDEGRAEDRQAAARDEKPAEAVRSRRP